MGFWDFTKKALPVAAGIGGGIAGFALGGPVGAGIGYAGGTALGSAVADEIGGDEGGSGGNGQYAPVYVDPKYYDTAQYDSYLRDVSRKEGAYADRDAPTLDWEMANADREMALQARQQQSAVAEEYRRAAAGLAPSVAEQQMRQGLAAANADALQVAASTRGGGGNVLLAQRQAQQQGAASALATEQNAAVLRAQETAAAREGWGKMVNAQRGQDLEMRGGSMAQTRAEADVELAQRAQNDAMVRAAWAQRLAAVEGKANVNMAYSGAVTGTQQASRANNAAAAAAAAAAEQARKDAMIGGALKTGGEIAALGFQQSENEKNRQAMLQAAGKAPVPGAPAPPAPGGGGPVVISGSSDHSYGDPWGQGASTYTPGSGGSSPQGESYPDGAKKPGAYYGGMGGDRDSSGDPYGFGYGDDKWP